MQSLEAETGVNTGWINNGGLFIASTKERLEEYKRLWTLGKSFGIESYILDKAETQKLYPLLNVKDVYGTLYSPADGTIDPAGYCTALTRGATRRGAKVIQQTAVTGLETFVDDYGTKRVSGVVTPVGIIKTNTVVNCAGVWSPSVGAMANVKVPLVALKHAYVVTERIEGIQNMPNVRDHDASVYLKLQGDALSVGGYELNPIFYDKVAKDFAFSLFDLDWDVFGFTIDGAVNRVPSIETTGIKSTVCGPESFTADHKPLMGEAPELRGFYFGCGFNSSGMMLSAGCGEELAKWLIKGRPEKDMYSYDIRRFTDKLTGNERWLKERSHESYAKNYSIVFPYDEPLAGRNMRKDPLHDILRDAGCVFQERHGWERPGWFRLGKPAPPIEYDYYGAYGYEIHKSNEYYNSLKMDYSFDFPLHHDIIKAECLGCREKVAAFNMSYFGKFYLTGIDARKAANWIFSNDVDKKPGSTVYTCMLNKSGGVEADLTVSSITSGQGSPCDPKFEGDGFYLAVGGAIIQHCYSYIVNILQDNKYRCSLVDASEDMAMLSIQGPNSRKLLQSLTDEDLSDNSFPFSSHKIISIGGCRVRAVRLSFVGELGWELHIPCQGAVDVYNAIWSAGQKHGLVNAGYRAIDSLSIEKGYRHWHADLRSEDTPLEAQLAFTCKLKKSGSEGNAFIGHDALIRQRAEGLKKRIACFTIDEHMPLHGLETIWRNDKAVGFLRRADYAFTLKKSVGYGYITNPGGQVVTTDWLRAGDYKLEHMGEVVPATLHLQSPFDPQNKRVKGIYS